MPLCEPRWDRRTAPHGRHAGSGLDGDLTVTQNETLERVAAKGESLAEFSIDSATALRVKWSSPSPGGEEPSYLERIMRSSRT
jgi:hypothetical protein